jgi:hypothetical protein
MAVGAVICEPLSSQSPCKGAFCRENREVCSEFGLRHVLKGAEIRAFEANFPSSASRELLR